MKRVLFGLAFGLALLVTAITGRFAFPERWEYSEIAAHLLAGQGAYHDYLGTRYYFYGPVVYPYLLSMVLRVSGQEALMLVLQAAMLAATCVLIYHLGTLVAGPTVAWLGAVLAAAHPGNLIYAGKLHAQALDVLFVTLSFLILLKITLASSRPRPATMVGAGVLLGLAALSRGTVLPCCAAWAGWWLWRHRREPAGPLRVLVCLAAGGFLMLAPIMVQGYLRYGRVIPLRTDTGANLWYGNHPGASGTSYTPGPRPVPVITTLPPALAAQLSGATEVEQHELLTRAATDFWRGKPAEALGLFAKKLAYFWWRSPQGGLLYPSHWTMAYQGYYAVVAGFALAGLFACLRGSPAARAGASVFLLFAASFSVAQAVFYIEGRHRWQLEPVLLVFTAVGMMWCWRRLKAAC